MKKFIFLIIMMMSVLVSAHAQQTTVEGSRLFDNTSVSVYGGGLGWINPSVVNESSFLAGVRPTAGVTFDKWITPIVGVELFGDFSAGSLPFSPVAGRYTLVDFMNLGANAELNLNNLFHKYKGRPDLVEVVPFAGLGWGHGFTTKSGSNLTPVAGSNATNFMTANLGTEVNFNMGKARAWQIGYRTGISYMLAGEGLPVQFNSQRAYVTSAISLTYKFGHKNSKGVKTHNFTSAYTVAAYDALNQKYVDLQKAYDAKPKEVEKIVEKVVEKTVPVEVVKTVSVTTDPHFVQGLAIVDATSIAVLDDLATEMKSNDNVYVLTGYASEEGNERFNQNLSLKRAEAIKKCLIDRGVSADRLTAVAGGVTTKFGSSYDANRRVVVEKK